MKKAKVISGILLIVTLLSVVISATSCSLIDSSPKADDDSTGSRDVIDQTVVNNEITINSDGVDELAFASASALRSAVSVYCSFTATYAGSFWNPTPQTQTYYSTGSGVIYKLEADGSAFVITNYHVVYDSQSNTENGISDKIYVYLYGLEADEYAIPAKYVGGSASFDIAVLRIDDSDILSSAMESGAAAPITVANSDSLSPGQTTIVIGNPATTELNGLSVTRGIVSVESEYLTMNAIIGSGQVTFRVIRTDAPINSGNSGGGMFNSDGELIGIVNAKINSTSIENIGYAIPSNVAIAIAQNIIDNCYGKECKTVMRALLGVTTASGKRSTSYDTETGKLIRTAEIVIQEVSSGALVDGSLKKGDVVIGLKIGETSYEISKDYHLSDAMLNAREGDTVIITVRRGGEQLSFTFSITEASLNAY